MNKQNFIDQTMKLAYQNTVNQQGKPFGAVIVRDGKVIAEGVNEVLSTHDPTAHAEIQAIRKATERLQTDDLSDCELYASGQPCPMCLSAIYWAKIPQVYYVYTEQDAKAVGLSTQYVYDQLALPQEKRDLPVLKVDTSIKDRNPMHAVLERNESCSYCRHLFEKDD